VSTKTRFGIIGAGAIAGAHLQAMQALNADIDCVGVLDREQQAAAAMAKTAGCQAYQDLDSFLAGANPEAVILCTPPSTHAPLALRLMECGVSVLCEKPLSICPEDAQAMLDCAAKSGVTFTMASKFRYVDDVIAALKLIQDGTLGEIILFENTFAARVDMSTRWNADPKIGGGGVLIDNGTHSVDIVRYLLGPVAEVQATEGNRFQSLPVEDTVHVYLRSQEGALASVDLSWSIDKQLDYYIGIYGTEGMLRVGWKESFYDRPSNGGRHLLGDGYSKLGAFEAQLRNFLGAMRGQEALLISPEEAMDSVNVIAAAYRSLSENDWAAVAPVQTLS